MCQDAYRLIIKILNIVLILCIVMIQGNAFGAEFLGSEACSDCHEPQYRQWQTSDHSKALGLPNVSTVIADFDNQTFEHNGKSIRFSKDDKTYKISLPNENGKVEDYKVDFVIGHYPLQQYASQLERGKIQVINYVWDSRSKAVGGQRWYYLFPDERVDSQHTFFWMNHLQNFNSRCADCHTTNYRKNFSEAVDSYASTWSEMGVGCEACHGPGSLHVERIQAGEYSDKQSGFLTDLSNHSDFYFDATSPIAINKGKSSSNQLKVCAECHSRREALGERQEGSEYSDVYRLSLLREGMYFPDGKIEDEVYVHGSFLQSKMHQAGVVCSSCHDPHSAKLRMPGDKVCSRCHLPEVFAKKEHHGHSTTESSPGCLECHMPTRTYMGVDDRHDHSFSKPSLEWSLRTGSSNACVDCHVDWKDDELGRKFKKIFGTTVEPEWPKINFELRRSNSLIVNEAVRLLETGALPIIRSATLLSESEGVFTNAQIPLIKRNLESDEYLIRQAAVQSAAGLNPEIALKLLLPVKADDSKSVRITLAEKLVELYQFIPQAKLSEIRSLLEEYEGYLSFHADSPSGQLKLGNYLLAKKRISEAEKAYHRALEIDPSYFPAMLNLADLHRALGENRKAYNQLEMAMEIAPNNASVQYAFGLHFVRSKELPKAITYLERSTKYEDAEAIHFLTYGLGLEAVGNRESAIEVLVLANKTWPGQVNLLLTLVRMLKQENRVETALVYEQTLETMMRAY